MPKQTANSLNQDSLKSNDVVYFKNLDVLRILAAIMVVIAHGYGSWNGWNGLPSIFRANVENIRKPNLLGKFFTQLIDNLGFGVDIFFLISGFLITYILLKEKEMFGTISIKKFMVRRSLRIWPLYYLIVIFAPILIMFSNYIKPHWMASTPEPNYLPYYFFLGNFDIISTGEWMFPFAHLWSICVEEHFYLIWPFILAFVPNRHLIKVFVAIIIASMVSRGYYFTYNIGNSGAQIYLNTICKVDVIIIGAITAYIYHRKPILLNIPKYLRILLLIGFIVLISNVSIYSAENLFQVLMKKYLFVIWVGFLMLNFMFNKQPIFNLKKMKVLNYLGKISFGIYIYHNILLSLITDNILARYGSERVTFVRFFIIYIGATVLMAIISWELFEKQILKLKKRFELVKTAR
jgi:peptidoglycan/LPS O-acetylase OafA/YrhL